MSVLRMPMVAAAVAGAMQAMTVLAAPAIRRRSARVFPEIPGRRRKIVIPTSLGSAPAVVYRPAVPDPHPPVHVNFHGGGFVMRGMDLDDPLCRYLAAEAGIVVINVDYALAPRHRFPTPPRQAFEAVQWVAQNGIERGWDGTRLTVGGQSAGGALAAAVARQALERHGPAIALQVLHYPPLDLATPPTAKQSTTAPSMLRPWMGEVFNGAYVPDPATRLDRLASPAHPSDTADLTGIAPALVITTEHDRLRAEGVRYAQRLRHAGALVEHADVPGADHGYDFSDPELARRTYALIARHVREAGRLP